MDEDLLRIKIYERLGLELGSLASESGNDWVRAEKEILEEFRQEEFKKLGELKSVNYLSVDKNSQEFQLALNSKSHQTQYFKVLIAQRNDLNAEDIFVLIKTGDRDVISSLAHYQKLESNMIDIIILDSTYATKKYLIENQTLSETQKRSLLDQMMSHQSTYTTLYEKLQSQLVG